MIWIANKVFFIIFCLSICLHIFMLLSLLIGLLLLWVIAVLVWALWILVFSVYQYTKSPKKGLVIHLKKTWTWALKELHVTWKIIKMWFFDIRIPLKNFVHWNISKLLVRAGWLLLWGVFWLPFLLLLLLCWWLDPIEWMQILNSAPEVLDILVLSTISENILIAWFEILLLLVVLTFLVLGWSYAGILQLNVYKHYYLWEKLPFKKNFYFDIEKFIKYTGVIGWIGVWLIIPICIFLITTIVLFFIFINVYGGFENFKNVLLLSGKNAFSVLEFFVALICAIAFIYMVVRVLFANYIFVESFDGKTKLHPAKWYVTQSFKLTKGYIYIWRIIAFIAVFAISLGVFSIPDDYVQSKREQMNDYIAFKTSSGASLEAIEDIDVQEYYANLEDTYSQYTGEQFLTEFSRYGYVHTILAIISFLVLEGLMEMAIYSFYKNALKHND